MRGFIYVATPYTRAPGGLDAAFNAACEATGALIKQRIPAFSPIAHCHPIAIAAGIDPTDHKIWLPADAPLMAAAAALLVVKLPGWDESYGVQQEVKVFTAAHKPVLYATVEELASPDFKPWLEKRLLRPEFAA
jgi:Domain of unknown function (DUF1937)